MLKRVMRRQESIRESRDLAGVVCVAMLLVVVFALVGIGQSIALAATPLTPGGIGSAVVGIAAVWAAVHLFREVLRLSRLMQDPELIMRLNQDNDLVTEVQWSNLIPFSGRRS